MKSWLSVILVAPWVAACGALPEKEPPPKPFVGTQWQVILELPVPGEQPSFRFGDGRLEGFGGCNRVSARYVQDAVGAKAIAIGRIDSGRRGCDPGTQAAENRILEVLQSVSSYSVTADVLTMSGSGGTLRMRAVQDPKPAAALTPTSGASLNGTRWTGVVDGNTDARTLPRLEFTSQGRVVGFTGCNLLNGQWSMVAGEVKFGALATTKRGCAGPEGDVERRVLAALNEHSRVRREGARLIVTGPDGARFDFVEAAAS
jgi:heat shock protein HslJ